MQDPALALPPPSIIYIKIQHPSKTSHCLARSSCDRPRLISLVYPEFHYLILIPSDHVDECPALNQFHPVKPGFKVYRGFGDKLHMYSRAFIITDEHDD